MLYEESQEDEDLYEEFDEALAPVEIPQALTEETKQRDSQNGGREVSNFSGRETPPFKDLRPWTDEDRFHSTAFDLRTNVTVEELVRQFCQRREPGVDRSANTAGFRRFVPVIVDKRVRSEMDDRTRYVRLTIRETDVKDGDKRIGKARLTGVPDDGYVVVKRPQGLWIHDGQTMERFSRKETGRNLVAKADVEAYYRFLIEAEGLEAYYDVGYEDIPTEARWRLQTLYRRSHKWATEGPPDENGKPDWRSGAFNFGHANGLYRAYLQEGLNQDKTIDDLEKAAYSRFFQMVPSDYYSRYRLAERLARECADPLEGQTVAESVQAYENLADMYSVVLQGAVCEKEMAQVYLTSGNEATKDGKPKKQLLVHINPATARVRYCSIYEVHDDRKAIKHINQWLGIRQLVDAAELTSFRVPSARDEWYGTATRNQKARDLVLTTVPIDPRVYLGEELGGVVAVNPNHPIPPGTEIWMRHLSMLQDFVGSVQTLLKLIRYVSSKGMTYKDFKEHYDPDLRNWGDAAVQVWRSRDQYHEYTYHGENGPGRELVALCPVKDWALWIDFSWIVENDNYLYHTWMRMVNNYLSNANFPLKVRVNLDNYGQHKDIGKLVWQKQATVPIVIEALKQVWADEIGSKTVHIRPVYYREVLRGLPAELSNDQVLVEFLQKLNKKSDRRCRLWAAFQSHGRKGGIRGFKIGTAVHWVEEGYGTDNGLSKEHQQGRQADLIMLAWMNDQFDKAVYLVRGVTYLISNNVDILKQYDLVGRAIAGGLHPDVAAMVASSLTEDKLIKWDVLLPPEVPEAVKIVEATFAVIEIKRLGEKVLDDIKEGRMQMALDTPA